MNFKQCLGRIAVEFVRYISKSISIQYRISNTVRNGPGGS
jgi:hypothetical protein